MWLETPVAHVCGHGVERSFAGGRGVGRLPVPAPLHPCHGSQPHQPIILCAFAPEETPKIIPSSAESVGVYTRVNNPRPGCWLGRGHAEGVPGGDRHTQGTGEQEHTAGCRPHKHPPPAPCRGTRAGSTAWDARRLLRCPGLPGSLWLCTSPCAPQAP